MLVWHYTNGLALAAIRRSGVLRPSTKPSEPLIVWFSTRQDWEPAAERWEWGDDLVLAAASGLPFESWPAFVRTFPPSEMHTLHGGLARIGVAAETAPHDWPEIVRLSEIDPLDAWAIEASDRLMANGSSSADYRGSFRPVRAQEWLAIEVLGRPPPRDPRWRPRAEDWRLTSTCGHASMSP